MERFYPLRTIPPSPSFNEKDFIFIFGEVFPRGYVGGLLNAATAAGAKIVYSTIGRRDNRQLRPLNSEELQSIPSPLINIPLEAGFDNIMVGDQSTDDLFHNLRPRDWQTAQLDWSLIEKAKAIATERFILNTQLYMKEVMAMIPAEARITFVHIMAGGIPKVKVVLPIIKGLVRSTGDKYIPSKEFVKTDIGRFTMMNLEEVTAQTFRHLIEQSASVREKASSVRYIAYGYHGTEILINDNYRWQTYTPYLPGWAKLTLEQIAKEKWNEGIEATVFNCPEVLTNSSQAFSGVELSLYPLITHLSPALKKQCSACLKEDISLSDLLKTVNEFHTSTPAKLFYDFASWPMHSTLEQLTQLLDYSDKLLNMHKDEKQLLTTVLSEKVIEACGQLMLGETQQLKNPVYWIGHDIITSLFKEN